MPASKRASLPQRKLSSARRVRGKQSIVAVVIKKFLINKIILNIFSECHGWSSRLVRKIYHPC